MRVIDRLNQYLERKSIAPSAFEKACDVANGYLGNQLKGKGSIGSEILERITIKYPDLNLIWLVTGRGKMILTEHSRTGEAFELQEEETVYSVRNKLIAVLREQLEQLETFPDSTTKRRKRRKS